MRRAQETWEPRDLGEPLQDEVWALLRRAGRLMYRHAPVAVILRRPDGDAVPARAGTAAVTVTGEPVELLLYAFGRRHVARVRLTGEPDAVAALRSARIGV